MGSGIGKNDAWRQFSQEIGADFVDLGFWKGNSVQAHIGPWTIHLDIHHVSTGKSVIEYTRIRAPFVSNVEDFHFEIYRKGVFSGLRKALGMQDIAIGDAVFDEEFIIKGNNKAHIRELLADPTVRSMFQSQPKMRLEVLNSEGCFGSKFPNNVHALHFEVLGVIKDQERLKGLFDLFATVLERLVKLGLASKEDPMLAS
ncbi:unnamed protein product [Didymodactylos carnosus]|uniref:DUF3137 domain-containing protein n=1 Tax=Didymodactylos carnosus TaxID=1234261 RepID=A0A8S2E417_9BILA|nr:unnamed protein product [Didymodactylos carnosus]CAF3889228.1 unnamed protein product [Didymodactylos carnosus]